MSCDATICGGCLKREFGPRAQTALSILCGLLVLLGGSKGALGALQFDVFFGYDGIVPEASWVPVVCEIKNDGPSFTGTIELSPANGNQGQSSRLIVELPTGTLKRVVMPVFGSRGYSRWDVRLVDERGKLRSEQLGVGPRKQLAYNTPLLGALPRTASGTPVLKPTLPQSSELQPASARILPTIFPDNPLVLEGLTCLYLNSERATELTKPQVNAIYSWLNAGGHLILAVEQPSDVSSSPWLKELFPCDLKDLKPLAHHTELEGWLRNSPWPMAGQPSFINSTRPPGRVRLSPQAEISVSNPFNSLPSDLDFEAAEMQVAVGSLREGTVDLSAGDTPLIVTARRGKGRVTALLFSPEREPVRSWKNLGVFWAKLAEVPAGWYVSKDLNPPGGWSSDGIFGAMIDSRQVHKLPVGWLLLLLLVYLVVIGPFDQFWLKKIGKPMLTWITFPCYVVLFSLIIYFIGYKLRAGESEWNELHLVDVLENGDHDELRGRTYSSVYSPANQRYDFASQQKYATLRGEFVGWGGGASDERTTVVQKGDGFNAQVFVPVWTSELLVSDWWQSAPVPLRVIAQPQGAGWQVNVDNRTDRKFTAIQLVIGDRIMSLGEVPAMESRTFNATRDQGMPLRNFVRDHGQNFQQAVSSRQRALGTSERGQISDLPNASVAVSFLSQIAYEQNFGNYFVAPSGLDLSSLIQQGGAVLLAWVDDYSPVKPMNLFSPRRSHRYTLWRVPITIQ